MIRESKAHQVRLTGVDQAYFRVLIDALKAKKEKDPGFKYSYDYIMAIVDKIFDGGWQ